MRKPHTEVSWEVEVRSQDGGYVVGEYDQHHDRKKDAVAYADTIRPYWAEHKWKCTVHVVRVERKYVIL